MAKTRMKKKVGALGLVLALCLVAGLFCALGLGLPLRAWAAGEIDLATLTDGQSDTGWNFNGTAGRLEITAAGTYTVTTSAATQNGIRVNANNVTLVLSSVTLTAGGTNPGIIVGGSVTGCTLRLQGTNTVPLLSLYNSAGAAIEGPDSLSVVAPDGTLGAIVLYNNATLTVRGGTVVADGSGSAEAAGIYLSSNATLRVERGLVVATGGAGTDGYTCGGGAGVGGAGGAPGANGWSGGTVVVVGGRLVATGGAGSNLGGNPGYDIGGGGDGGGGADGTAGSLTVNGPNAVVEYGTATGFGGSNTTTPTVTQGIIVAADGTVLHKDTGADLSATAPTFAPLPQGYAQQGYTAMPLANLRGLGATVTGIAYVNGDDAFESDPAGATIGATSQGSLGLRPKTGLAQGTHTGTYNLTYTLGSDTTTRTLPVTLSQMVAVPTPADAAQNAITVDGGTTQTAGVAFGFTAAGHRQGAAPVVAGDGRYVPMSWSVNPTGTFAAGGPYTASVTLDAPGAYTLAVIYRLESWDGTTWRPTDAVDQKTLDITVRAAGSGGAAPANPTAGGSPQTGDGSSLPLWALCGGAALAGLALCGAALRRRFGRKAG